ncbi:MAG: hypothetical protein Tsb0033_07820 [Winogradskyella sp.]
MVFTQNSRVDSLKLELKNDESRDTITILLAAPKAVEYYPYIGMTHHNACFLLTDETDLK